MDEQKDFQVTEQFVHLSNDWKNTAGQKPLSFFFADDLIYFLILLPVMLCVLRLTKADGIACFSTVLVPVNFALLTLCRKKPRKVRYSIALCIPLTILMIALFILLRNYSGAFFSLLGAISSLVKLYHDYQTHEDPFNHYKGKPPSVYLRNTTLIAFAALDYIAYMFAFYNGFNDLSVLFFIDFAAVFALMLIYRQRSGAHCLSQWNDLAENGKVPETGEKNKFGGKLSGDLFAFWVIVSTGIVSLIVFIIAKISGVSRIDSAFFKFLMILGNNKVKIKHPAINNKSPKNNNNNNALSNIKPHSSQFSQVLGIILQIILWLFIIAIIIFVIIAVSRAIKAYYRKLGTEINEESHSLLSPKDALDNIKEQLSRIRRRFSDFSRGGSRMTIRRLFFSHVKRHGGNAVKSSDAPFEIGGKIAKHDGHDMNDASKIYEKARYSNEECDDTDVTNMKKALK